MGADLQREARALGDPTRYRLFSYLADAPAAVSVAELTAFARLNHNAVRQHLAVLRDAGLVTEEAEQRDRPGRPRLLYRVHPEAAGAWGTAGPYAWLAGILSAALSRGLGARQAGRQEGRRRAAELAGSGDPAALVEDELARRGFRPRRAGAGPAVEFVLGRCPFAEVAAAGPETVCQLHLGLAEGLAEGLGGLTVAGLAVRKPSLAGCRLTMRREPTGAPEGGEPACWAHLVCPDCGAVEGEGHRPGCDAGRPGRGPAG
jgi:predicted ArsR family transcriptional regulator